MSFAVDAPCSFSSESSSVCRLRLSLTLHFKADFTGIAEKSSVACLSPQNAISTIVCRRTFHEYRLFGRVELRSVSHAVDAHCTAYTESSSVCRLGLLLMLHFKNDFVRCCVVGFEAL